MPRASSASLLASGLRQAVEPPAPPKGLSAPAKRLWKGITEGKPADFFAPEHLPLLEVFCETAIQQRAALERLKADPTNAGAVKAVKDLATVQTNMASKLRLTKQSVLRGDSAENRKSGVPKGIRRFLRPECGGYGDDGVEDDSLIGGFAVSEGRVR